MSPSDLQIKKAYYRKVRQSNYAASLRLEGFPSTPQDGERRLPTRETLLEQYRNKES
ncbi:YhfG family protein [Pseudomonas sp. HR96]|uniref:YhfG family protein n=1 Tax=Pseudomonas sp. HR96 TaxID=1027966 RepID=UPI002A7499B7|nr:YhfG family protein [Pseudomonas sp. HR96]WPP01165.1 YhfG family protein [Pseudomonas sp. HR96]